MYFTREPIIQTIISAREGYTICIRSLSTEEEVQVEVVELVTFDTMSFYRCTEKGTMYLLPANNYQILEERVQSMVLKTTGRKDKEIRIGKGKEEGEVLQKEDKKKSRKKNKAIRAKESENRESEKIRDSEKSREAEKPREMERMSEESTSIEGNKKISEKKDKVSSRFLIPPPEGLISESLHKAAMKRAETVAEPVFVPPTPDSESTLEHEE